MEIMNGARPAGEVLQQPMNEDRVREAMLILQRYKAGKADLDRRIIEDEEWWKLRHWKYMEKEPADHDPRPASGWLVNVILNRHADAIDNFPEPICLPREQGDEEEAKKLTKIVPVILEQTGYKNAYRDAWWYKLKSGCGVYGVFWDSSKMNGLGDISIRKMNVLNLFWEPGVTDIQASEHFFSTELVNNSYLRRKYPQLEGKLGQEAVTASRFLYDDNVDTTDKTAVVDWYYHDEAGRLQYCKFASGVVLYATENENTPPMRDEMMADGTVAQVPAGQSVAERGWYTDGKYPFIFDSLFPQEGTPCGYGYIDLCKNAQAQIDTLNKAIIKSAVAGATPRFFIRNDGAVNEEEYADWTKPFVHTDGNLGQDSLAPILVQNLNGTYVQVLQDKIQELRETSGNTETATGTASASVTAASAIAALQEASGKLSRDMIAATYEKFRELVIMVIDRIRQFYDMPRQFRITGEMGEQDYTQFSNEGLQPQPQVNAVTGQNEGYRTPIIDIEVKAAKASSYSRAEYNELALQLYAQGFFTPENADPALAALDMMDFKGIEKVKQKISQNGTLLQQMAQMQQTMMQMAEIIDSTQGTNMAESMAAQITGQPTAAPGQVPSAKTTGDMTASGEKESTNTAKARKQTREATAV